MIFVIQNNNQPGDAVMIGNNKNARRLVPAAIATALAVGFGSGCSVETSSGPPPVVTGPVGSLVLQWTLDEGTDPNVCVQSGATTFDATVTTIDGQFAGEFQAACTQFQTSISVRQAKPG